MSFLSTLSTQGSDFVLHSSGPVVYARPISCSSLSVAWNLIWKRRSGGRSDQRGLDIICGQTGRGDWKSCVESAFITGKHTNFLLFDDRYGWRCQSKQSSRSRVRTLKSPALSTGDKQRRETQRSSSLMLCSIFQHLRHKRQKNNKATRSCLNLAALYPPLPLGGDGEVCMRNLRLEAGATKLLL